MEIKLCVRILPYFYFMFELIDKLRQNEDWVTLLILLVFFLIVSLYRRNPNQTNILLKFWKINRFSIINQKEQFFNPFSLFNFILLAVIFISYSLLSYFFYERILSSSFGKIPFLYFIISITLIVSFRYFFLKIAIWYSGLTEILGRAIYNSLSLHGSISIFILFNFVIFYYGSNQIQDLILLTSIATSILIIISHTILYFKIALREPQYSFYIFLYICGFKLAPWLWLYKIFY